MNILDVARSGKKGFSIMDESFDFKDVPFNFVSMIVFESKINARATDGGLCKVGDRIRVVSDKAPEVDAFGTIKLHGAIIKAIDDKFFTMNGVPVQGELLNSVARVVEVHLRYDNPTT